MYSPFAWIRCAFFRPLKYLLGAMRLLGHLTGLQCFIEIASYTGQGIAVEFTDR